MKFLIVSLFLSATAFLAQANEIHSNSAIGQKLLAKSSPLESIEDNGDRSLENNNYYTAWMTKYSMKFTGCHSVPQFEREEGMRSMLLARYKMCPSDNCAKCPNAGEYIVNMRCVTTTPVQFLLEMSCRQ